MIENCTAVILAGGESSRMGQDKADVLLAGETLLTHTVRRMQSVFSRVVVSVREPRSRLACLQVCDLVAGKGPIMGIATALESVNTHWVFVVGCDMPLISPDLVLALAKRRDDCDAVVALVHKMPQPLAGFYSKNCLSVIQAQIERGERSMMRLLDSVETCLVSEEEVKATDPQLHSFISLDTPDDVRRIETIQ